MSSITSSAYPVTNQSGDGDLFLIVRNGQTLKMNRAGLQAFIESLAPNTLIELSDTPGTMVGQAGKALVVNATEDGHEYAPSNLAPSFLSMPDTFSSFGSLSGQVPIVNGGETALDSVLYSTTTLPEMPSSLSGASLNLLRVNATGTGYEHVSDAIALPAGTMIGGYFYINHSGTSQAYTTGSTDKVLNDDAGTFSDNSQAPPLISDIWDQSLSQFDFSMLQVGDEVEIRVDMNVTTTSANQDIDVNLNLGVGSSGPFTLGISHAGFKTAGTYPVIRFTKFYVGSSNITDYPGEIVFSSDSNVTIDVYGWYVSITRRTA